MEEPDVLGVARIVHSWGSRLGQGSILRPCRRKTCGG
jgi:hypothetical protein